MSEYYGVSPSSDFFAHYGIKGMRWGVRKAIESGNTAALARHYDRARKKLNKLNDNANIKLQEKHYKAWNKAAGKNALSGAIGGATGGIAGSSIGLAPFGKYLTPLGIAGAAGVYGAAGALGGYMGSKMRANAHKKRTTKEGHAAAVRERNEFKREMDVAFRGTRYGTKKHRR